MISVEGASSKSNCSECPEGFICTNSTIPIPCNPGFYCPYGVDMTPCPRGTFSNVTGAKDSTVCTACTPGYWCFEEATANPLQNPCPVGHYCPLGTGGNSSANFSIEPVPCPAGTYRDQVGGASLSDCSLCPAGFYCPNATTICFNCTDAAVTGSFNHHPCLWYRLMRVYFCRHPLRTWIFLFRRFHCSVSLRCRLLLP